MQRSRGEAAELPPAIISWPWARRLQAEPVGGRGVCCLREVGCGRAPLGTGRGLSLGPGFTGGRKGSTYYAHVLSPALYRWHFILSPK